MRESELQCAHCETKSNVRFPKLQFFSSLQYRTVQITMCVETLSWFKFKVPQIPPSTAGVS